MRFRPILRVAVIILIGFIGERGSHAAFHLWQIEEVIGGVDGDTSAQAVQFRMRSAGQTIASAGRVIVRDAAGQNPIIIKDMMANVVNGTTGDRVLIASTNFINHTIPAVSPDFTMTQTIPAGYLAAGRLTYEDDFGTIYWSLSWGGTNYTGVTTGNIANDADGIFGPSFGSPLPASSSKALLFAGSATAASLNNAADYTTTPGTATFVNNARQLFVIFTPRITAIGRESDDIRVTWTTIPGRTNFLQRTTGTLSGGTNFTDILAVTNSLSSITNHLDIGAATNFSSGYYRLRIAP